MSDEIENFTRLFSNRIKRSSELERLDPSYKNSSLLHTPEMTSIKISKKVIHNSDLAYRINLFEIIESDYDTIVRFYSNKIYIFSYITYGSSFLIADDMKRDLYRSIINAFTTSEDVTRMLKDDLDSLYNIKESYFAEKSSEDVFTLGKELLKNIFDKTRDKILAS